MEGLLVSAATGALKPVLGKLAALMGAEYGRFKRVRREVQSLADELAAMHAFLLKMSEEEHPDPQDKAWMKEVRELSYDMEDSLDEFMLRVDDRSVSPEGFINRFKKFLTEAKTRRRIAKSIEDLKAQAKEVGDRNRRYRSSEITIVNASNAAVDPRALAIFEDASKLVGINGPRDELVTWLAREYKRKHDASEPLEVVPLNVVSIVGFGGMGKTTLANQVFVELKNQFKFDCWAFVSVSRNPDLMKVLRTILSEVSNQPYAYTEAGSIQQLIGKITDFLKDKRYLIVVDDVWKIETWNIIRYALFPDIEKRIPDKAPSTIITTTRIHDVAEACCSSYGTLVYKMRPLTPNDSKKLFYKRIFSPHDMCPAHLEEVSNKILEKCDGLPLAIISISGLLANKPQTNDQWNRVQSSFGRELGRNPEVHNMVQILSLSYFDLPHHLKTCLLYLSTFREDTVIDKRRLIRRWIAEGFIPEEQEHTRYELGERCFNELINRSLVQAQDLNMYGEVTVCQVHDTILDFIISKSEEENFVTIFSDCYQMSGPHRKICRLSLHSNSVENISQLKEDLSHVRSVTMFTYAPEALLFFMSFSSLRVLDLGGCTEVEDHHLANIGNLFRLKYLSLRNTEVCELPEQIRKLKHLETLDVSMGKSSFVFFGKEKSRKLPASIIELQRLAHLVLDTGIMLPAGIRSMTALEDLESVDVFKQSIDFAQDLGQLAYLRSISFLTDCNDHKKFGAVGSSCEEYMDSILLSLSKLRNLRSLSFHVVSDCFFLGTVSCAPHSLQKLEIKMGFISKVPNWVRSLVNLQTLVIFVRQFDVEDFMAFGRLPALVFLHLIAHESFCGRRFTISGDYGFHCLRHFDFGCVMPVMFGVGAMPKLKKLAIMFSPERMALMGTGDFHFGIEHLPSLDRVDCVFHLSGNSVVVRTAKTRMGNISFRGDMDRILNQVVSTTCDLERAVSIHAKSPQLKFRHTHMWTIED
ncbi:unnamed protein product [Urochloa decumbens]|uniref:Uncharacterized protein n=1 Tax=Urochloa decumbens TaxID=240449 RepID=A0ABC9C2D1_9POAL